MEALFTARTSNGPGSGVEHLGPCSVFVSQDSVFDGATVHVEAYPTDTPDKYVSAGREAQLRAPGPVNISIQGTYFLRGRVSRAGENTSIDLVTTQ